MSPKTIGDGKTMENNYFKGLTRKEYIRKAREIVERDHLEDVSIRRIAKELGCSSAALYRYFDSKSELMYYVNLNILEGYIIRLNQAEKSWKHPWDVYMGIWDCYCKEAFRHPKVFNMLFFENDNVKLNKSIREYYQMFPENIRNTNTFFWEMLNTPGFLERDFEMCKKCVEAGVLTYDNAVKLNRMACMLYKGYFKTVYDEGIEEAEVDKTVKMYIDDLEIIVAGLASDLQGYDGYYKRNLQKEP